MRVLQRIRSSALNGGLPPLVIALGGAGLAVSFFLAHYRTSLGDASPWGFLEAELRILHQSGLGSVQLLNTVYVGRRAFSILFGLFLLVDVALHMSLGSAWQRASFRVLRWLVACWATVWVVSLVWVLDGMMTPLELLVAGPEVVILICAGTLGSWTSPCAQKADSHLRLLGATLCLVSYGADVVLSEDVSGTFSYGVVIPGFFLTLLSGALVLAGNVLVLRSPELESGGSDCRSNCETEANDVR